MLYNEGMSYEPGVSNITKEEAARRTKIGWKAFAASAGYVVLAYVLNLPQIFMLAVGIPIFLGVRTLMEGSSRFSVTYGLHGLYDEGEGAKHTKDDEEVQQKDRTKAQSILFFSTLASVLGALFCYLVLI